MILYDDDAFISRGEGEGSISILFVTEPHRDTDPDTIEQESVFVGYDGDRPVNILVSEVEGKLVSVEILTLKRDDK